MCTKISLHPLYYKHRILTKAPVYDTELYFTISPPTSVTLSGHSEQNGSDKEHQDDHEDQKIFRVVWTDLWGGGVKLENL